MKTKLRYYCEFCSRTFSSKIDCSKHESYCSKRIEDNQKLVGLFLALVHHFEKQGYTVAVRYFSNEDEPVIYLK